MLYVHVFARSAVLPCNFLVVVCRMCVSSWHALLHGRALPLRSPIPGILAHLSVACPINAEHFLGLGGGGDTLGICLAERTSLSCLHESLSGNIPEMRDRSAHLHVYKRVFYAYLISPFCVSFVQLRVLVHVQGIKWGQSIGN